MILIDEILVSDDVIEEHFLCNLDACKGACCWEGDYGAPLNQDDIHSIENHMDEILSHLLPASVQLIEKLGWHRYFEDLESEGTMLHPDGACVFMTVGENGVAQCGIEKAHYQSDIPYKKPLSCHLYPIRIKKNDMTGFEAMNYDRWDICSAACDKGKKFKLPVYEFCKEAIERAYGAEFYEALDHAARYSSLDQEGSE